jgi:protein-L-isoaspartate O-methyltransferase
MVIPVGDGDQQILKLIVRQGDGYRESTVADVRFVPLLGRHGF